LLCAALCAVVGCDSDDGTGGGDAMVGAVADADPFVTMPPDVGEPWIELGTGARRFETLEEGAEVPIIAGIQGGFHVWGAFRGGGFRGTDAAIDFSLELDGEELGAAHYTEPQLERGSDGRLDYPGVAVVFARNEDVEPSSGRTMRLSVRVEDADGVVLTASIEIVPVCCE